MKSDWLDDIPTAPQRRKWPRIAVAAASAGCALLALGLYAWRDDRALFWLKGYAGPASISALAKKEPLLGAAALAADDPALRFSETHIGQIVFSNASDTCRRHLFDNSTGRSYWVDDLPCRRRADPIVEAEPPDRLKELRRSFQR